MVAIGTPPTKVAGTLRRAVRWSEFTMIPGERHMECAYYFDFCRLRLCNFRVNRMSTPEVGSLTRFYLPVALVTPLSWPATLCVR